MRCSGKLRSGILSKRVKKYVVKAERGDESESKQCLRVFSIIGSHARLG